LGWNHILWIIGAALIAFLPLAVLNDILFRPGIPYTGDGLSNLLPPLHARHSIRAGHLLINTELWYGGRPQYLNPLWKGLYPPAWPLYIPGIPVFLALKTILGIHYVSAGLIVYYYASKDFSIPTATVFGLIAIVPMTLFIDHYEKVLGWPWAMFIMCNLIPSRWENQRAGYLVGGGLGAMLLAGDNYHFFYMSILIGCVFLATKAWYQFKPLLIGGLIGAPKFALSIAPTILGGANRPSNGVSVTLRELLIGTIGFWIDTSAQTIQFGERVFEGFTPVGLGIPLAAVVIIVYEYARPSERWKTTAGAAVAAVTGILLATRWQELQSLPIISIFRVSARAVMLVAVSALLISWIGTLRSQTWRPTAQRLLVTFLIVSVMTGVMTFSTVEGAQAQSYPQSAQIADDIVASGCDDVWIENRYQDVRVPQQNVVAYYLTKQGVSLQAVNYGKIGQEYSAMENGAPTFRVLIISEPIPTNGTVRLTGGWSSPVRGQVPVDLLELERVYNVSPVFAASGSSVYIYTTNECSL
jgi:hypothetical protein